LDPVPGILALMKEKRKGRGEEKGIETERQETEKKRKG
jgi:hypothetical protein